MSNKIDPNLLAAGIGGLAGANFMSTGDNDLLATAAGVSIGAGTGFLLNTNISDEDKRLMAIEQDKIRVVINPDQVEKMSKTFSERKKDVRELAESIAKQRKNTGDFDRKKPFTSLNTNNLDDFLIDLENIKSDESLTKLKVALSSGSDELFINKSELDTSIKLDDTTTTKIPAGAKLETKMEALKEELVRLGYKDGSEELETKLKMFEGMMDGHGHNRQIFIKDGKINLDDGLSINLTYKSVTDKGDVAIQSAQNKNIYNIPRVSFTATGFTNDLSSKAMAEALGITMADAFKDQMEKEMAGVAGLAPDEAAALAYHRLKDNPAQFKDLVKELNGMRIHDEVASGQYKENLRVGNNTRPTPSNKAVSISNTVDYAHTLNFLDNGQVDKENPFKKLEVTSNKAKRVAKVKEFLQKKVKQTGIPNSGTSGDHVTQMTTTHMEKVDRASGKIYLAKADQNKLLTVNTAHERNPVTVYDRSLSHETDKLPHVGAFEYLNKRAGSTSQFGSAIPLQTLSLNTSLGIENVSDSKQSMSFINMISDVFGSSTVVADGAGLGNRDILRSISTEGYVNLDMKPTSDSQFMFTDENHKRVVTGELSFDDFRDSAKKGISVIQGKADKNIKDIRSKLNTIKSLTSSNNSAQNVLTTLQKKLPKVFGSNSAELTSILNTGTRDEQISALQEYGKSKIMAQMPKTESLYSAKDVSLTETAVKARQSVIDSYGKISGSLDETISSLDSFIANNGANKQHLDMAKSFFPKAGQIIGYNADGSEVKLKQNYRSYEFAGSFWNDNKSEYSVGTELGMLFKGRAVVGDENEVKTYGLGTKAQLQNRSGEVIQKIALLQDLAEDGRVKFDKNKYIFDIEDNDGKSHTLSVDKYQLKTKSIEQIFDENKLEVPVHIKKKLSDFKNIAVIAEDDSSGTLKHKELLTNMLQGKDVSQASSSSMLGSYIQARTKDFAGDKSSLSALADFVMATSKDKSSMDYLVTAYSSVIQQSGLKFSNYTNAVGADKDIALADLKRYSMDMFNVDLSQSTSISRKEWGAALNQRIDSVLQYHTSQGFTDNFYNMAKNKDSLDSFVDFFVQERKYRSSELGDSLIKPTAINRTVEHELGSGTTGKTASWNSMSQLRMNGFSDSDIGMFGKMSSHNVADYQSVSMLTKRIVDSLDTKLDDDQVRSIVNLKPDQRRTAMEKLGVKSDKLVESYSLKNTNDMNIKTLPILMEDSRLFGGYTDNEGNSQSKKLTSMINKAIEADIAVSSATTDLERDSYKKVLNNSLKYITESILPVLGGRDNLGKKVATLEAPRSMYSLATPVGGSIRKYAKEVLEDSHVVAVSSQGLLSRLKEVGKEFDSVDDIMKSGLLKKTSEKGVYEVFYDAKQKLPMFSMLTREPSVGMGSTTSVRYLLDTNIEGDAKNLYTMYDNEIFKRFKFQDFDMDHFIEILPDVKKTNYDQLMDIYHNKGKVVNDKLDDLVKFASHLGVKGNKTNISTFFDILDNPEINTREKFLDVFLEDTFYSKIKTGDRKTISPTVTKLAFTMNSALSHSDLDFEQMSKARIVSNYLVENLLKSQHISNETYKKDPIALASKMAADLESKNIEGFNEKFGNYMEDNIIKPGRSSNKMSEEMAEQIRESYRTIQRSMLDNKDKLTDDITPTHLKSKNPAYIPEGQHGKALESGVESLDHMVFGTRAGTGVVSTIDQEVVDSAAASLAGKAKKSYHSALDTTKHIINNNKKLLAGAAAATIGAALLTQEKPSFGNNTVSANTNGMMMEASRNAIEETREQQSLMGGVHRATDYLYSYNRGGGRSVSVEGSSTGYGSSGSVPQDVNKFMYGDGMSAIRILTE